MGNFFLSILSEFLVSIYACCLLFSVHALLWRSWLYLLANLPRDTGGLLVASWGCVCFQLNKPSSFSLCSLGKCFRPPSASEQCCIHSSLSDSFLHWCIQNWMQYLVPRCNLTSMEEWKTNPFPQPKGCIPIHTWGSLAVLAARAHSCLLCPRVGHSCRAVPQPGLLQGCFTLGDSTSTLPLLSLTRSR